MASKLNWAIVRRELDDAALPNVPLEQKEWVSQAFWNIPDAIPEGLEAVILDRADLLDAQIARLKGM